jgi:hypothetical protein
MKTLIFLSFISFNAQAIYIQPYQRQDGTFVQGHNRSAPDGIKENNYGYRPHIEVDQNLYGNKNQNTDNSIYGGRYKTYNDMNNQNNNNGY